MVLKKGPGLLNSSGHNVKLSMFKRRQLMLLESDHRRVILSYDSSDTCLYTYK